MPWRAAHLLALASIAVTQPVLDLLGGSPTFFVAHTAGPAEVLLVALLAIALVPAVLIGLELVVALVSARWAWRVHLVLVAGLTGLIVAQFVDRIPGLASLLVLALGAVAGVALARWYRTSAPLRSACSLLALTPLLFAVVFVHWLIDQSLYEIGKLCPWCMVVWSVTIPSFLFVTVRNAHAFGLVERSRFVGILARNHGLILMVWVLTLIALIVIRFWDEYFSTLY